MIKSNWPLVSAIIAVKNETMALEQCLKSLLGQTYPEIEIIVVDDGSDAATKEVLSSFNDPKISLLTLEKSLGQSHARNLGFERAKGKYIAIQDADDHSENIRIEKQVNYLENNSEISIIGSGFKVNKPHFSWNVYSKHEDIFHQMLLNNPLVHSSVMFRTSLLQRGFAYNSEFDTAEDYELFARTRDDYKYHNLPDRLVTYHINKKSEEASNRQLMLARTVREGILESYAPNPDEDMKLKLHAFAELRKGLTRVEINSLIFALSEGSTSAPRDKSLSKILYTQFALYSGKFGLKLPFRERWMIAVGSRLGVKKILRLLLNV